MTVGQPDYWKAAIIGKPTAAAGQTVLTLYETTSISAGSNTTVDVYTPATGTRFIISSAIISTDASCIQTFDYIVAATTYMKVHYDIYWSLIDSDIGAAVIPAGVALQLKIYNNDTATRNFYITVWGTLESV